MVRATTYLCLLIVIWISIDYNYAARVFYEFEIKEIPKVHNETRKPCNNNTVETEEVITGSRRSLLQVPQNGTNSTDGVYYTEVGEFTHDENGYHVKYNVTELAFDNRLSPQLLKIAVG